MSNTFAGMILHVKSADKLPVASWEFTAEVVVLYHPTEITVGKPPL